MKHQWHCESIGDLFDAKNRSASSDYSTFWGTCCTYLVVDISTRDEHFQKSEELWTLQHTGQRLRDLIRALKSIMRLSQNWSTRCHLNMTWWNMIIISWTGGIPFSPSLTFHVAPAVVSCHLMFLRLENGALKTQAKRGGVNIEKIHTISDPWQPCGASSAGLWRYLEHLELSIHDLATEPWTDPQLMPPAWQFHLLSSRCLFRSYSIRFPTRQSAKNMSSVMSRLPLEVALYGFFASCVHFHHVFFFSPGAKTFWHPVSRPEKYHGPALLVLAPDSAERGDPFLNADCKEHQRAMVGIRLLKSLESLE